MRWSLLTILVVGVGLYLLGPGSFATVGADVEFESEPPGQERFTLETKTVEQCGPTCGAVTAALTNANSRAATNVTVQAHVYAGQTTDDGARLWSDVERIGFLKANETATLERQVAWSVSDANAVREANRWITVEVVVSTDDAVVVFTGQERI
jgi:hypothetical protein